MIEIDPDEIAFPPGGRQGVEPAVHVEVDQDGRPFLAVQQHFAFGVAMALHIELNTPWAEGASEAHTILAPLTATFQRQHERAIVTALLVFRDLLDLDVQNLVGGDLPVSVDVDEKKIIDVLLRTRGRFGYAAEERRFGVIVEDEL